MNVSIDIGNTNTKFAVFDNNNIVFAHTHQGFEPKTLLQMLQKYPIQKAIVASVAAIPALDQAPFEVLYFNHHTPIPIQNNYHTPQTLGLDRLAGVVAAHFLFPKKNCLVIDAGTCITLDFISENAQYEGGSIHPGIAMRAKAMHHFTHRLPLANVHTSNTQENDWLGKSTHTCLQAGAIWGAASEIEGMAKRYEDWLLLQKKMPQNTNLTIIMTGGAAPLLERCMKRRIFAHGYLILEGLNQILNWNEHTI